MKIYEDEQIVAKAELGRYSLYVKIPGRFEKWFAECVKGEESLNKYHKGSIDVWIKNSLRNRKKSLEKTVARLTAEKDAAQQELDLINKSYEALR